MKDCNKKVIKVAGSPSTGSLQIYKKIDRKCKNLDKICTNIVIRLQKKVTISG